MKNKVSNFLNVFVPDITDYSMDPKVSFYDNKMIHQTIWEKPPQLYIEKAIIIEANNGKMFGLGTVPVTEQMCSGHFSFFPMLPLAVLAQAVGQVGELLILSMNGNGNGSKIPIAVEVSEVRSLPNKGGSKKKNFIIPGDKLLVVTKYLAGRLGIHKISADVYADDGIMTTMKSITFINAEKSYFKEEC